MKDNRAIKTIKALYNAVHRTMNLYELEKALGTDWSPRGINEARKIFGVKIDGHNPYTLKEWPSYLFPVKPIFNSGRQVYEYPREEVKPEQLNMFAIPG